MKVFIICTVRNATPDYKSRLENYVHNLEQEGNQVHLPHRDTDQDGRGYDINRTNMEAIKKADEVHIFYNPESQGTHFDMGVSFALGKKIKVVESVSIPEGKSYQGLLAEWLEAQNSLPNSVHSESKPGLK
ncbi:nucleoside 2-deoxyribosyltransferase [Nafulsella turpanensis]|uniref:nucleoside 2-deoxyribosyltransferase n=1 Tax=Nafulsella turpanensis TaxID=1265690 RepID=UPI00034B19BF|nr:nucleoside 2-deoxyribosyltransferase [Nafulsella turpanensis]